MSEPCKRRMQALPHLSDSRKRLDSSLLWAKPEFVRAWLGGGGRRLLEAALRVREAYPAAVYTAHAFLAYVLVERDTVTPSELDLARAHLAEAERGLQSYAEDPRFEDMREFVAQLAQRLSEESRE